MHPIEFAEGGGVIILVAKTRISSVDLAWLITERLRDYGFPVRVGLAVVADGEEGWRVVIAVADRRFMRPSHARRLASVQEDLRAIYSLSRG